MSHEVMETCIKAGEEFPPNILLLASNEAQKDDDWLQKRVCGVDTIYDNIDVALLCVINKHSFSCQVQEVASLGIECEAPSCRKQNAGEASSPRASQIQPACTTARDRMKGADGV